MKVFYLNANMDFNENIPSRGLQNQNLKILLSRFAEMKAKPQ
jgi:hypothetical protein